MGREAQLGTRSARWGERSAALLVGGGAVALLALWFTAADRLDGADAGRGADRLRARDRPARRVRRRSSCCCSWRACRGSNARSGSSGSRGGTAISGRRRSTLVLAHVVATAWGYAITEERGLPRRAVDDDLRLPGHGHSDDRDRAVRARRDQLRARRAPAPALRRVVAAAPDGLRSGRARLRAPARHRRRLRRAARRRPPSGREWSIAVLAAVAWWRVVPAARRRLGAAHARRGRRAGGRRRVDVDRGRRRRPPASARRRVRPRALPGPGPVDRRPAVLDHRAGRR